MKLIIGFLFYLVYGKSGIGTVAPNPPPDPIKPKKAWGTLPKRK